jgi:ATP-dependent Lhr-like helicase
MEFAMDASATEFFQILKEEAAKDFDPLELLYPKEVPVFDKYDEYLPDDLVRKEFAQSILNIGEMKKCVARMSNGQHAENKK